MRLDLNDTAHELPLVGVREGGADDPCVHAPFSEDGSGAPLSVPDHGLAIAMHPSIAVKQSQDEGQRPILRRLRGLHDVPRERQHGADQLLALGVASHRRRSCSAKLHERGGGAGAVDVDVINELGAAGRVDDGGGLLVEGEGPRVGRMDEDARNPERVTGVRLVSLLDEPVGGGRPAAVLRARASPNSVEQGVPRSPAERANVQDVVARLCSPRSSPHRVADHRPGRPPVLRREGSASG